MTGKTHTSIGVASTLAMLGMMGIQLQDVKTIGICCAVAATASTLPDIDIGAAKKVYKGAILGIGVVSSIALFSFITNTKTPLGMIINLIGFVGMCLWCLYAEKQSHRGFTHSFTALGIVTMFLFMFTNGLSLQLLVILAFVTSYLSHIAIDLLNTKGEQLFWPLPKRKCFGVCKANGFGNDILNYVGIGVSIIVLLAMLV